MLYDALPFITALHIEKASHLRIGLVSNQLRDVREISIYNLFNQKPLNINEDIATKSVPFLIANNFPHLESVAFWGKDGDRLSSLRWIRIDKNERGSIYHLMDSFSGAFDCGSLPHNLQIIGLRCPNGASSSGCRTCQKMCRKFPVELIGDVDLCFPFPYAISKEIIKAREGGRDYLQSETRFMQLLGKGRVLQLKVQYEGDYLCYEYDAKVKDELKNVSESSEVDVTKLSSEDVMKSIKKQHPKNISVYLSEESFDYLKSIGIPISYVLLDPMSDKILFARDFIKMIALKIQGYDVAGLHQSVSIVWTSFFDGLEYVVMTNPIKVAEFHGFESVPSWYENRTLIGYFFDRLKEIGCIFHCLSKSTYRGYGDDDWATRQNTKWVFRINTNVAGALTSVAFRTLKEATLGRITIPQTIQNTIRENQLPFIEYVINGWVGTTVTDQLIGDATVKAVSLTALKRKLEDSFYRNWNSFITNDLNVLSKSDVYKCVETGEETTVVVRFNRGFTQDDFMTTR